MSNEAIGMIETRGYVPSLASADAMVKAANVDIVSRNEVGGGLVSVVIKAVSYTDLTLPTILLV